jgi:hypothetical protein
MATAVVMAGLGLLAIPLHRLTSATASAAAKDADVVATVGSPAATHHSGEKDLPAVLRLRLLAPAKSLDIETADGEPVLALDAMPAGESEHDVALALADDSLDLNLTADFGDLAGETAVFLTVMPDSHEEKQAHAIGGPVITSPLHFQW